MAGAARPSMATPIPQNAASFTLDDIARITGGRVLRPGPDVRGISTDTRAIAPGAAFLAITGERFDGHAFLAQAAERGAAAFILALARGVVDDDDELPPEGGVVLVPDTLAALGALARAHRERWAAAPHPAGPRALVAVAGSAGKTTTTRTIAALLAGAGRGEVHATLGNLNNAIGVPMTLFGLEARHRFAVVEIGTNQRGEVATLASVARPDVAVVTAIGVEHTEGLGTLEDVAEEEGDLFAALPEVGIAVGNADDPHVVAQIGRAGARRRVGYGAAAGAAYRIAARRPEGLGGAAVRIERGGADAISLSVPLLGEAGALAAAAALGVVEELLGERLDPEQASRALLAMDLPADGRLTVIELADGTAILDDSYNANPVSMRASLRAAAELAEALGKRLVLALGEMRELGALSAAEHDALGAAAAAVRPAALLLVGGDAARAAAAAEAAGVGAVFVETSAEAAVRARELRIPGDLWLVKGSRGVRMERVVEALRAGGDPGADPARATGLPDM